MSKSPGHKETAPHADASRLTDHLFRHEAGKLVSVLTRLFGIDRLDLAEDIVQETLARALQTWPYSGTPDNPAAWLTQTAKNLALDFLRREKRFRDKAPDIVGTADQVSANLAAESALMLSSEIQDAKLRLLFACCHPLIPQESQTALALKTLCGFSAVEIASAFLTTEVAVAKRLTRAKQRIRDLRIPFEIPAGDELGPRLDGVLHTLYLLFNEGYKATSGESLIREELCAEAVRLARSLAEHPAGDTPRTHALTALMLLNGARLPARADREGNILRLKDQDRSLWNRAMISHGMLHLGRSSAGGEATGYHLQAGIAACHSLAPDYDSTDWPRILSLYDRLAETDDSPLVALNRAVAVANVRGPAAGMEAVAAIPNRSRLDSYCLYYAVVADFEARLNRFESAAINLKTALRLTDLKSEQAFLTERLRRCEELQAPTSAP